MITDREPDDLDQRERELSALELKLDEQDQEARKIRRDLQRDKAAALRRVDHPAVEHLNEQLVRNQAVLDSARETRTALAEQWQALQAERARRREQQYREQHGPRPCLALSVPGRLSALGISGHQIAGVAHLVEEAEHAARWQEPDRFLKGVGPRDLERAAAALNTIISLVADRDEELLAALTAAREFARTEAHNRRPPHPWRNHQGVGFP
jgi:DNA repair exonuclease SbcCD ATPase subunit